ncbi:MAG: hypothetical protein LBF16_08125 [Pseudomonadales bacterium]|jgi:hypothetical protein|nr:hypothetical protein [Pseudomonadales bacterium]
MLFAWLRRWFKPATVLPSEALLAAEKQHVDDNFGATFDTAHGAYLQGDYRRYLEVDYPALLQQRYTGFDPKDYPAQERPGYALALTGGGIRSASFGIGVMQALNNPHLSAGQPTPFSKLSYLSSVSGGGYAGCALTWYQRLHGFFPFGQVDTYSGPDSEEVENKTLSYIRLHGKYLTPHGLGVPGLLASVLMSVLHSTLVYMLLFALLFALPLLLLEHSALGAWLSASPLYGSIEALGKLLNDWLGMTDTLSPQRLAFATLFLWLSVGGAGLFAVVLLGYAASSFIPYWFSRAHGYRVAVQRWQGRLLLICIAGLFMAGLPLVTYLLFGATLSMDNDRGSVSLLTGSSAVALFLALHRLFRASREASGKFAAFLEQTVSLLTVPVFISFLLALSFLLGEQLLKWNALSVLGFASGVLLLGSVVNLNQIAPHKMYRDRLMETFLKTPDAAPNPQRANTARLSALATAPHWSPYPLINCNLILSNAKAPRHRARVGDSFLLSPLYCGSSATGYVSTTEFERNLMTLPTAMAISGAAANPHAGNFGEGKSTQNAVSFLMTFFGLRLGYWCFNPASKLFGLLRLVRPNYLLPGLGSLLGLQHDEQNLFIELSDGGHFDNTGVYELIRRRVPVIFIADGGADPDDTFDSLGNVIERCRVDFGTSITFPDADYDLTGLIPGSMAAASQQSAKLYDTKYALAQRGYAVGDIVYPPLPNQGGFIGKVVYLKTCLTRQLPGDLYAYKSANPSYPNQPTLDQFFDERQFEAYRELGYQLTKQLLNNQDAMRQLP